MCLIDVCDLFIHISSGYLTTCHRKFDCDPHCFDVELSFLRNTGDALHSTPTHSPRQSSPAPHSPLRITLDQHSLTSQTIIFLRSELEDFAIPQDGHSPAE